MCAVVWVSGVQNGHVADVVFVRSILCLYCCTYQCQLDTYSKWHLVRRTDHRSHRRHHSSKTEGYTQSCCTDIHLILLMRPITIPRIKLGFYVRLVAIQKHQPPERIYQGRFVSYISEELVTSA